MAARPRLHGAGSAVEDVGIDVELLWRELLQLRVDGPILGAVIWDVTLEQWF